MVEELTNGGFDEFIKEGTVLIDFFADWCMPCVMMSPILDELSEKFKGKIKIGKVNIEDSGDIAQKYEVSSIPNFIVLKDDWNIKMSQYYATLFVTVPTILFIIALFTVCYSKMKLP